MKSKNTPIAYITDTSLEQSIIIKGCPYKIIFFDEDCDYLGLTSTRNKTIRIHNGLVKRDLERIILHELLHAYFFECGLQEYCADETLVNYFDSIYHDLSQNLNNVVKMHSAGLKGAKNG